MWGNESLVFAVREYNGGQESGPSGQLICSIASLKDGWGVTGVSMMVSLSMKQDKDCEEATHATKHCPRYKSSLLQNGRPKTYTPLEHRILYDSDPTSDKFLPRIRIHLV